MKLGAGNRISCRCMCLFGYSVKKMLLGERDEDHVDLVVILNSMCVVQVNFVKTVEKKRNQKKYFVEVPD